MPRRARLQLSGLPRHIMQRGHNQDAWLIWYPIIYWVITAATSVVAVPKILFRDSEKPARWTSPPEFDTFRVPYA